MIILSIYFQGILHYFGGTFFRHFEKYEKVLHAGQTWLEERSTIGMQIQVASSVLVRQHREEEEEGMRRWANRGEGHRALERGQFRFW